MRKHRISTERIIVALTAGLLIMTAIAFHASAVEDEAVYPTDPYTGEPITWDVQGQGNEDAIEEAEPLPEFPEQTYSFGELAEVKAMEEGTTEEQEPEQAVHIALRKPETGWSEGNIRVVLYRSGHEKHEIWLYRQQDWQVDVRLPAGKYTFGKAETADGTEFTAEPGTIEVGEGEVVEMEIQGIETAGEKEAVSRVGTDVQRREEEGEPQKVKKGSIHWIIPVTAGLAVCSIITVAAIIRCIGIH